MGRLLVVSHDHTTFASRLQAAEQLADLLVPYRGGDTIVVGIARGGVMLADPIADRLGVDMDVTVCQKIHLRGEDGPVVGALAEIPEGWRVVTGPPAIPDREWSLTHLEAGALRNSQTLKQLQQRLEAAGVRMKLDATTRLLPELAGGAEAEREGDGTWAVGPALAVGIPIFDFGQARRAAGMAQLRRWADLYTATTVETRAAVRAACQRLRNARNRAGHLLEVVVPLAERITRQTQEQYNAMQVGVFSLLSAKQRELQVKRQHIAVRREYWQVRAAMERMANGGSPEGIAGTAFIDQGDAVLASFETTEGH